jgi:hypothetical protein
VSDNTDTISRLSERLRAAADARAMAHAPVWARAWEDVERGLLERLLDCGPTDDEARYRLQVAIQASRQVRRTIEHQGASVAALEKELAVLDGRVKRPIA